MKKHLFWIMILAVIGFSFFTANKAKAMIPPPASTIWICLFTGHCGNTTPPVPGEVGESRRVKVKISWLEGTTPKSFEISSILSDMKAPMAIVDPQQDIFVAERTLGAGIIRRFEYKNNQFNSTSDSWSGTPAVPAFTSIDGLETDKDGNVYLVDSGHARIVKFDKDMNFVGWLGKKKSCSGPACIGWHNGAADDAVGEESFTSGAFRRPEGVAIDSSGNIFVTDKNNQNPPIGRVQKFMTDGSIEEKTGFYDINYVRVDKDNNVFVSDRVKVQKLQNDLTEFSPNNWQVALPNPEGIAIKDDGTLYAGTDGTGEYRIHIIKSPSESTQFDPGINGMETIDFGINDKLYVINYAESGSIKQFDASGNFIKEIGGLVYPIGVTARKVITE